jgi:hypothetical protein
VLIVIALAVAFITLQGLLFGTRCLVPDPFLKAGEVGTAETSIYGVALYRETGTDHIELYDRAVWWFQATGLGIWAAAVVTGTSVYLILGRLGWFANREPNSE